MSYQSYLNEAKHMITIIMFPQERRPINMPPNLRRVRTWEGLKRWLERQRPWIGRGMRISSEIYRAAWRQYHRYKDLFYVNARFRAIRGNPSLIRDRNF